MTSLAFRWSLPASSRNSWWSTPEVDDRLPEQSYIYFDVAGEDEFNRYSRELAERQYATEGLPIVCVRGSSDWRHRRVPV